MKEGFEVPLRPGDRRIRPSKRDEPEGDSGALHLVDRFRPETLIAYDPAFSERVAADLELRLHHREDLTAGHKDRDRRG